MEHMGRKIKAVRLFKKVERMRNDLGTLLKGDLQFQAQDHETRDCLYVAYDSLKKLLDNIR